MCIASYLLENYLFSPNFNPTKGGNVNKFVQNANILFIEECSIIPFKTILENSTTQRNATQNKVKSNKTQK